MKHAASYAIGLALSLVYVSLVGVLSIQIAGVAGGAVFDLSNTLTAVTEPNAGLLQLLGIAVASGAVLWILMRRGGTTGTDTQRLLRLGFGTGTLVQIAVGVALLVGRFSVLDLNQGPAKWLEGWITSGASNSAVHVVFIVTVYLIVTRRRRTGGTAQTSPA
ncbi:hypothetical protein SAMN06295909_2402 [Plantibacter sp. VKM Ac-1784]|uniref:DUF4383 domain-containing protein n=1 Tax=Plantibacter elymi (nom. nud.) TaxID=199708 RepID=A0ABY1RE63_9MICO|nr:hypothetical protein [Plantibacter sp. VKM Ac-1784]SMQ71057.1 hypothetical protein SAMN06295909_2402 [Plantibacter sp. VKM Ac-1784]